MSRQFPHATEVSVIRPGRCGHNALSGRRLGGGAAALAVTALLLGWNPPPADAQQTPDTWTGQHRAVLPSGLTVTVEFAPLPGVTASSVPGKLGSGAGGASSYADGLHGGDPAETFRIAEDRLHADGSWRTMGTLQISFSRPVRNPRLHVSGLTSLATGKDGSTATSARLTVTGGSPSVPSLVGRTDWTGWTVGGNSLAPAGDDTADGTVNGLGTLELAGTVSTVDLRVEQRSTARAGSTTAPEPLSQAYTVTLDEGLSTAPQGYGNASHLLSDLFLGQDAAGGAVLARTVAAQPKSLHPLVPAAVPGIREPAELDRLARPMVELDHASRQRSPWSNPVPPALQPGRGEYQGADPTVTFPTVAAIGRYYSLTVPVNPGSGPATLAGWIDFDHSGGFDATERVQTEVLPGSSSATLEWTVPDSAATGQTWARLRLARDSSQLVGASGFADSGEVLDQRVQLTVGAARPEISGPVSGAVVADSRPEIRGEGAVQGATVEIVEGSGTLCRTRVGSDGTWSCRPDAPLGQGAHSLVPVETTRGGVVLRGEAVRLTVKSDPPAAPTFTLPEYTNDPGLLIGGTADPGSTVSVTDAVTAPGADRVGGELCSTAVADDRSWYCLPVENLADGNHQLTATAVDAAGNRTASKPVLLVVDTVAPDKPVLSTPSAGDILPTARPRLTGSAEAGSTVTVTATAHGGASVLLCSVRAATDGTWSCTPAQDLPDGDQALTVTATDRAGNATAADAVNVHVPKATAPAAPAPSSSPTPIPPSPPATPAPAATPAASVPVPAAPAPVGAPSVAPAVPAASPTQPTVHPPASPSASLSPAAPPSPPSPASSPSASIVASGASVPSKAAAAPSHSADAPDPAVPIAASASTTAQASDSRVLAAPPVDTAAETAAQRSAMDGWRAAGCGVLLLLAAITLATRRVLGRGPGRRRR
ncbi:Ig-like domain-containing protein [Kitasatospora sp. MAP5-34]|uniref:Ig-like domain-containing protein n=1 Tax=Kitasatospora sp. MAP5-34 TaxID=3035102 RepID=UPI0024748B43|nr:Ig-like domain-containing protein [Kitasatospora sp. MAP5-34]MDH6576284.1 hypothetical protein [Kitasatospora sp. MAP5-34]